MLLNGEFLSECCSKNIGHEIANTRMRIYEAGLRTTQKDVVILLLCMVCFAVRKVRHKSSRIDMIATLGISLIRFGKFSDVN